MVGADEGEPRGRIVFLLRGYPSIDHLAPIIELLSAEGRWSISLIGVNILGDLHNDTRVRYLRETCGIPYHGVDAIVPAHVWVLSRFYFAVELAAGLRWPFGRLVWRLADRLRSRVMRSTEGLDPSKVLGLAGPQSPDLLIFDHCARRLHKCCAAVVQKSGGKAIAFPHGIFFFLNELRVNSLVYEPDGRVDSARQFEYLDHLVVTNKPESDKAVIGLVQPEFAKNISVIGSLRFSRRWIEFRDREIPINTYLFPNENAGKLKILFLCPKRSNNVHWEELLRVIGIMASYEDHAICIKGPAQGNEAANDELCKLGYRNVDVVSTAYDTAALVDWADVVLWVDTSAIFEAYLKDKPVAHLKYLWSNRMFIDGHPAMWQAECRDDVHEIIGQWRSDLTYRPYSVESANNLLDDTVNNVLQDPFKGTLSLVRELMGDARPSGYTRVLQGSRVLLVPFDSEFITDQYLSWLHDGDATQYIEKADPNTTMDDVRKFCQVMMESKEDIFFAIVSLETQTHIGNVRVGPIDWDQKVTGFGILIGDGEFRGKGIGTEVMELIKEFCFVELGLNELRFPVVCENEAAIRLYRRADFREAGSCSRNFEKSGRSLPQVEFVETAVEWKNRSRAGSVECRIPR